MVVKVAETSAFFGFSPKKLHQRTKGGVSNITTTKRATAARMHG